MSRIELQAWLPSSDLSGAPDATFSPDDQLTDAGFNPVLWGEGDGFLELHADHADTQYLQRRGFIRAVDTDSGDGLFWWILEEASVRLNSAQEQGGKVIRWDGRGMLYYLDRYKLGQAVWAPGQPNRGSVNVFDYWTWVDQSMIAILTRFMEEGQNDTRSEFLNKLAYDFDRVNDSNGNTPTNLTDYQVRIGTGGLQLAADTMRQGTLLQVLPQTPPLLQAFRDLDEYRTDRSSATFAAGKVRFAAGANVATELPHKIAALRERTHTLTRRQDGQYATEALNGSGEPYMDFMEVPWTSDPDAVEAVVGQSHLNRQKQSTAAVIRHKIGPGGASGADGYMPGPGSSFHYWLGDLVSVHTGTGEYDLNEQALEVAGIKYFLRGADWMVEAQLGAQVLGTPGAASAPAGGSTVINRPGVPIQICRDPITGEVGEGPATRLYHTDNASDTGLLEADRIGTWDQSTATNFLALSSTPPDITGGGPVWTAASGRPPETRFMRGFVSPAIGSGDLLSAIQNGANLRSQLRCRSRAGVGIDEDEQEDYGAMAVRLYRPGTGFVATLFALARVTTQFRASSTSQNRSWDTTLAAFPGAVSTDRIVIDYGSDHVAPTDDACGAALIFQGVTTDLPRDQTTTTDGRSWVEIAEITSGVSYGSGSLPSPTVLPGEETHGECEGAASCCHAHAHGEHGEDGALHSADQISGLPAGSGSSIFSVLGDPPSFATGVGHDFRGAADLGDFTASGPSAGTVALRETGTSVNRYQLTSRGLYVQVGNSQSAVFGASRTIPDGGDITLALVPPRYSSGDNASIGLRLKEGANHVQIMLEQDSTEWVIQGNSSADAAGTEFTGQEMELPHPILLRIMRADTTYDCFVSQSGGSWAHVFSRTGVATPYSTVDIYATGSSSSGTYMPAFLILWIVEGSGAYEPW